MRFELTVALKYLIPKWRQLSVSIISLISVLVISLVVWLVVLFLSVTDGIERKWVDELVALNAHVRMTPNDLYYRSYFYQIDSASFNSNYTTKTIGEKLLTQESDPYDPYMDIELSLDFPPPDKHLDGRLKDPVKEGFEAIQSLSYAGVRAQEYEVGFGNLRLQLLRDEIPNETKQTFLTQVSYVAAHEGKDAQVNKLVLPPSAEDFNNLLQNVLYTKQSGHKENASLSSNVFSSTLKNFFAHVHIEELKTQGGFILHPSLFPKNGILKGVGILRQGTLTQVILPKSTEELVHLQETWEALNEKTALIDLIFEEGRLKGTSLNHLSSSPFKIVLSDDIPFKAHLIESSLQNVDQRTPCFFHIEGKVQQVSLSGKTPYNHLKIAKATTNSKKEENLSSLWTYNTQPKECTIPKSSDAGALGEGILISKHFKTNGVRLGDRGYIAYYAQAGSSTQEQRIPVFVAGFYDPGMIPVGNKLLFVNPQITATLRSNTIVADSMLGNGINIWLARLEDAEKFKEDLKAALEKRGILKYWDIQSYQDYEFTKPILEQLQSDKNLFTLIAIIILVVACSNIISMLILLVNDKKKEIGILQSMGASPQRIALIFGLCGFVTGVLSCVLGVSAAVLTLRNLQTLVDVLSFFQGREAFQTAFYGSSLPNTLSVSALSIVLVATLLISLLAGIIPAIKASKIRPTEILRSEG